MGLKDRMARGVAKKKPDSLIGKLAERFLIKSEIKKQRAQPKKRGDEADENLEDLKDTTRYSLARGILSGDAARKQRKDYQKTTDQAASSAAANQIEKLNSELDQARKALTAKKPDIQNQKKAIAARIKIGNIYYNLNFALDQAINHFSKALEMLDQSLSEDFVKCYMYIISCHQKNKNFTALLEQYGSIGVIDEAILKPFSKDIITIIEKAMKARKELKDFDGLNEIFKKFKKIFSQKDRQSQDPNLIYALASIYNIMASCQDDENKKNRYQESALGFYQTYLGQIKGQVNNLAIANCHYEIAQIHEQRNDQKQAKKNYQAAGQNYHRFLDQPLTADTDPGNIEEFKNQLEIKVIEYEESFSKKLSSKSFDCHPLAHAIDSYNDVFRKQKIADQRREAEDKLAEIAKKLPPKSRTKVVSGEPHKAKCIVM